MYSFGVISAEVIIVCHTEFGFVHKKKVIFDKKAIDGVRKGVNNLIKIADKYRAKVTFTVCPEVVEHLPSNIDHEIGLHVHPGWEAVSENGFKWYVGDAYLKKHCYQSKTSTVLRDYPYKEQLNMIKTGKDHIIDVLGMEPKTFVAGRWSENSDTHKALVEAGITHDCTPSPSNRDNHFDWSSLPRICMPYHPSREDYQVRGDLPLLLVPISQYWPKGNVNPEREPFIGLSWIKACFLEYYLQKAPLFHICLHSPCMTDSYFVSVIDKLLQYISRHDVEFRYASNITKTKYVPTKNYYLLYLFKFNRKIFRTYLLTRKGEKK